MRRTIRAGLTLVLLAGLTGCLGLGGAKAPPTLFSLTPSRSLEAGASLAGKAEDALLVLDPETDRSLAVTRIAVQVDASNIAYLPKAQWVERPADLFGTLLAETIRAGGKHLVFTDDEAAPTTKHRLSGRLVAFGYDAREQAVVVRYDALKSGPGGAIATRRFEAIVPGIAPKAEFVGPALNKAANKVAGEVADWVG
jgi:cholesterol transport system auxiliary component